MIFLAFPEMNPLHVFFYPILTPANSKHNLFSTLEFQFKMNLLKTVRI